MEFLQIGTDKIKIILTPDDMDLYSLTCDNIDYDNTETRRAFWSIFDEIKHKNGFDAAGGRIFIQAYPSKGGGCELYVSKVSEADKDDGCVTFKIKSDDKKQHAVYRFTDISSLLSVCSQLQRLGYCDKSHVYSDSVGIKNV